MALETKPLAQRRAAAPARAAALSRWFPAFASRDYRLLWLSNFSSFVGWWMTQLALGWIVLEITNSPFQLGLVSVFSIVPTLFFAVPGGVLADRVDRRGLILATQAATLVVMAALAALVIVGRVGPELIYATSFLTGALMSLNSPARQALVVDVVPRVQLVSAVALNSTVFNVTRIVGPTLAGVLLVQVGNGGTLVVGALCYLGVLVAVAAMRHRKGAATEPPSSAWRNLVEGVRYSLGQPTILAVLGLVAILTAFTMPYMALLPAFARDVLGLDPGGLGLLNAAVGAGALASTTVLAVRGDRVRRKGWLLLASTLTAGLALVAFTQVRALPLALLALLLLGVASFGQLTLTNSLLQLLVPDALRGRVLSLYMLLWGTMPLGTLVLGAVADRWGTPLALALGGAVTVTAAFPLVLRARSLHRLD